MVEDNFRENKTQNEFKEALIRGWIGDKGTQYLHKCKWTRDEWQNHDMIMERLNKYKSDLNHFRQTTGIFSEFWTELKRKFELARNKSTRCNDHKNCSASLDGYTEEEQMSLIYNRVNDQRIRDCIDMLPDAEHTLEKYLHLGETQELSQANVEAFNLQGHTTASIHALKYSKNKGKGSDKSSGKLCTYCGFNHKFGQCPAKEAKCKICQKIEHCAKVCRSKYRKTKQNNDRSNNQSARFTGNEKKSTNIHLVADDGKILETTQRENIPWLDIMDVYSDTQDNTSIYTKKGFLEVHNVHKTRSHQMVTQVEMFPTNGMGKVTGKNPTIMKCKPDTGASVNVMPLSTYQYINPSKFDKKGQPISGYGHNRTILKGYNGNPIQHYGIRVILGKWNNQY